MQWRRINGDFFWTYWVSDSGDIKREDTLVVQNNVNGYKVVSLKLSNGEYKQYRVHRLVAMAFIPNPNNLPQVNHKDEVKHNNSVSNLEWCTALYNNTYGTRPERIRESNSRRGCPAHVRDKIKKTVTEKQGKPVTQYNERGDIINTFKSTKEAERVTGVPHNIVSAICRGKKYKDFIFRYSFKEVHYERRQID